MKKANLFIVGAAKCGTTSLHEYLDQHPEIFMSVIKEPHFFSEVDQLLHDGKDKKALNHTSLIKDKNAYQDLFEHGQNHLYRGESSPSYLWDERAAQRIFNYNPHSKIIVLLRDPIMRAFSHYQMGVQAGFQKKIPFYKALKEDLAVPADQIGWNKSNLYVELGFYFRQINRYAELFPEGQIMVLKFEEFVKNHCSSMIRLSHFLNVNASEFPDFDKIKGHNKAIAPKYPIIDLIKGNILVQKTISLLPDSFKERIKNSTYQEGYRRDLVLDNQSRSLLNRLYKEELLALKARYGIDFYGNQDG